MTMIEHPGQTSPDLNWTGPDRLTAREAWIWHQFLREQAPQYATCGIAEEYDGYCILLRWRENERIGLIRVRTWEHAFLLAMQAGRDETLEVPAVEVEDADTDIAEQETMVLTRRGEVA